MFQKCKQKVNVDNEVNDTSCESDMNEIDTCSESEDIIMTILSEIWAVFIRACIRQWWHYAKLVNLESNAALDCEQRLHGSAENGM